MLLLSLQQTLLLVGTLLSTSALAAPSTPSHLDACGLLANKNVSSLSVTDVANCYQAVPFNSTRAKTTLETVHTLFKDYYVFTDAALNPRAPKPFKNEPIDVLKRLEMIGKTKYTSDFQFHMDIRATIEALKDGHASYDGKGLCGRFFLINFSQLAGSLFSLSLFHAYKQTGEP